MTNLIYLAKNPNYEVNKNHSTPVNTRGGVTCLGGVSISCRPVNHREPFVFFRGKVFSVITMILKQLMETRQSKYKCNPAIGCFWKQGNHQKPQSQPKKPKPDFKQDILKKITFVRSLIYSASVQNALYLDHALKYLIRLVDINTMWR